MLTAALRLALLFEVGNAAYPAAFDSASIAGPWRRHPEDNLERQTIHEHANRDRPPVARRRSGEGVPAGGAP